MQYTYQRILLLFLCLQSFVLPVFGQGGAANEETSKYKSSSLPGLKAIAPDAWESERKDFVFKPPTPRPEPKNTNQPRLDFDTGSSEPWFSSDIDWLSLFRILGIVLLASVLLYIVFKVLQNGRSLRNPSVESEEILLEQLEKDLPRSNPKSFLEQAKAAANYRLVLRLYYLDILKTLHTKGFVEWKREKTNGQYVRELRAYSNLHQSFAQLSRIFDYLWYKETMQQLSLEQYQELLPKFEGLLKGLQEGSFSTKQAIDSHE